MHETSYHLPNARDKQGRPTTIEGVLSEFHLGSRFLGNLCGSKLKKLAAALADLRKSQDRDWETEVGELKEALREQQFQTVLARIRILIMQVTGLHQRVEVIAHNRVAYINDDSQMAYELTDDGDNGFRFDIIPPVGMGRRFSVTFDQLKVSELAEEIQKYIGLFFERPEPGSANATPGNSGD